MPNGPEPAPGARDTVLGGQKSGQAQRKSTARQYAEALCLAILVAVVARVFVLQAYKIPSSSMLPTLLVGDHLLISKLHYGIRSLRGGGWLTIYRGADVGDVVVFVPPPDRDKSAWEQRNFVKRVVAVGGEVVELREGRVYVDGRKRDVPNLYLVNVGARLEGGVQASEFGPVRLQPEELFVLGDNRTYSQDSRDWGAIEMGDVLGKAVVIYWSWDALVRSVRWERVGDLIH